jgi:hypothetical protein
MDHGMRGKHCTCAVEIIGVESLIEMADKVLVLFLQT